MAGTQIKVKDADGNDKYYQTVGTGANGDGFLPIPANFLLEVAKGNVVGHSIITKFGRNGVIGTDLTHVSIGGQYQTPTSSQSLEILSSDANDDVGSAGAHKVIIEGLDADFVFQTEEVTMNGTAAVALENTYMRVFRGYVSESGSYVTTAIPSHVGQITLRNSGGGVTWFIIDTVEETTTGFGIGQTQIGTYTVPAGKTAYLISKTFSVESTKTARIYFFARMQADDVTTPFRGIMRLFEQHDGINRLSNIIPPAPADSFMEKSEVGFFAKVSTGSASVSTEFQLLLVDD